MEFHRQNLVEQSVERRNCGAYLSEEANERAARPSAVGIDLGPSCAAGVMWLCRDKCSWCDRPRRQVIERLRQRSAFRRRPSNAENATVSASFRHDSSLKLRGCSFSVDRPS